MSNFALDVQELQHAVSAQQIASPHPYKKDYKEQIVGKGPHDPTIGYPEHDHHKKVGELTSLVSILLLLNFMLVLNRQKQISKQCGGAKHSDKMVYTN